MDLTFIYRKYGEWRNKLSDITRKQDKSRREHSARLLEMSRKKKKKKVGGYFKMIFTKHIN